METKEKSARTFIGNFWQQHFEVPSANEQFLTNLTESEQMEINKISNESNGDKWLKLIKGLFLFLPGVWLLFMSSTFLFEAYFSMNWDFVQVLSGVPWLILYGFMVLFGIGDVNDLKHLSLPLSVVGGSFFVYLISLIVDDQSKSFLFYYSIYLFPFVLITPLLVRNFINVEKLVD